jgi:hypothetical protein
MTNSFPCSCSLCAVCQKHKLAEAVNNACDVLGVAVYGEPEDRLARLIAMYATKRIMVEHEVVEGFGNRVVADMDASLKDEFKSFIAEGKLNRWER